jgi:predicted outer membrane protein
MVRRRLKRTVATVALLVAAACGRERDMPDHMEMPDTMPVVRAMHDPAARDSVLDVMPGGEMARGDSAAAMRLLDAKR